MKEKCRQNVYSRITTVTPLNLLYKVAYISLKKKAGLAKQNYSTEACMYQSGCLIKNEFLIFAAERNVQNFQSFLRSSAQTCTYYMK